MTARELDRVWFTIKMVSISGTVTVVRRYGGPVVRCAKCGAWWKFVPAVAGVDPICVHCVKSKVEVWEEAEALRVLMGEEACWEAIKALDPKRY